MAGSTADLIPEREYRRQIHRHDATTSHLYKRLLLSLHPSLDNTNRPQDRSEYQSASTTAITAEQGDQKLPPNHLGANVPEGFSTDFASQQAPESTSAAEPKDKMSEPNQSVVNSSADGVDTAGSSSEGKFGQAGLLDPNRSPSGPPMAKLRGSRASISAPTKERIFNPHAQNPGRIPTAGGVSVGSKQYEQRRASRVSSDMGVGSKSPPQSPPPVAESPAESSKDGAANGALPSFETPNYGTDSKPEGPASVEPSAPAAPAAPAEEPSTTEKVKETVKENVPGVGNSSTSPSSPSKERRASRFDLFKEKIGIGGSKK